MPSMPGNTAPRALVLREDLRTRLGGGQIFQLQALTDAQVRAVLQDSARLRGLVLGEEVLDFVLHRFSRDLGNLMPLLTALDHFALQTQRAITIPLIRSMLENHELCIHRCIALDQSQSNRTQFMVASNGA